MRRCEECDFKATSKRDVMKHYKAVHMKERKYKCDICGYSTTRKALLKQHISNAHGGRKFKCEICGYSASSQRSLTKHQFLLKCLPFMVQRL